MKVFVFSIGYILNISSEVDNFYPTHFQYLKIFVNDEPNTSLLMHWQRTSEYIKSVKEQKSAVLVQ
jgi:protein phosphatase slingshot